MMRIDLRERRTWVKVSKAELEIVRYEDAGGDKAKGTSGSSRNCSVAGKLDILRRRNLKDIAEKIFACVCVEYTSTRVPSRPL